MKSLVLIALALFACFIVRPASAQSGQVKDSLTVTNSEATKTPAGSVDSSESRPAAELYDEANNYIQKKFAEFEKLNPRQARVVELCYFAELTDDQIAALLNISSRTVQRDWLLAKDWLSDRVR